MSAGVVLLVSADSFLFGNHHLQLICEGFRLHEESPLMYGTRFPRTTRSNPGDEAPMTTESCPAHLPPFPFIQCKPFLQSSQKDQFPLAFSECLPHPSDLHAELPAHLTPTSGSSQKTQPNISQIFLIFLATTNDTSKQEHPFPGSIDGFRQLEKNQALNSHWMVWKMAKHKKCRVVCSTSWKGIFMHFAVGFISIFQRWHKTESQLAG